MIRILSECCNAEFDENCRCKKCNQDNWGFAPCPECEGSGFVRGKLINKWAITPEYRREECENCYGTGRILVNPEEWLC